MRLCLCTVYRADRALLLWRGRLFCRCPLPFLLHRLCRWCCYGRPCVYGRLLRLFHIFPIRNIIVVRNRDCHRARIAFCRPVRTVRRCTIRICCLPRHIRFGLSGYLSRCAKQINRRGIRSAVLCISRNGFIRIALCMGYPPDVISFADVSGKLCTTPACDAPLSVLFGRLLRYR